jgi:hypothetical protein
VTRAVESAAHLEIVGSAPRDTRLAARMSEREAKGAMLDRGLLVGVRASAELFSAVWL